MKWHDGSPDRTNPLKSGAVLATFWSSTELSGCMMLNSLDECHDRNEKQAQMSRSALIRATRTEHYRLVFRASFTSK